jgi:hypothetical protein
MEPSSGRQNIRDDTGVELHTLKKFTHDSLYIQQDCVLRHSRFAEKVGVNKKGVNKKLYTHKN